MMSKTEVLLNLIFLISLATSCERECPKEIESFASTPFYPYYGYEKGHWYLKNDEDSIKIYVGFANFRTNLYTSSKKCEEISFIQNYIIQDYDTTFNYAPQLNVWVHYTDELKLIDFELIQGGEFLENPIEKEFTFEMFKQRENSKDIQYYFTEKMNIEGIDYRNILTYEFDMVDTFPIIQKLYIAPYIGPIQVELSDSSVYQLYDTYHTHDKNYMKQPDTFH